MSDNTAQFETKKPPKHSRRDGRSVTHALNRVPTKDLIAMGYDAQVAELILATRRVLPVVEDPSLPQIDARKLWEKIGKPHGRFRDWADHYIKPVENNAEISAIIEKTGIRGRPRKDYTLSRSFAAELAMQANTAEGTMVRRYFLLMEGIALRLSDRNYLRGERIVGIDNTITHQATKALAEDGLRGSQLRQAVADEERRIKSRVVRILTGSKAGHWREVFGKGVRDILSNADLAVYESAYKMAAALFTADSASDEELDRLLKPMFGGTIDMRPYLEAHGLDPKLAAA
ncbi:antA/AntB antirepressor family protein [Thiococcus pfennigii]|uniref:antA/AntB antirepressor family protein n=1 Tax=Thiococcus pfennigii TaxID=1057 RepID=UPI001904916D|nr:antA/AntB antirepressor family protein [Thiococcus pfennigii]